MSHDFGRDTRRVMGWAALAGGVLMLLFWLLYFTEGLSFGQDDRLLSAFESAFPVVDAVLAIILATAGVCLLRGKPAGTFCLVVAAAMSLYLGILDMTFYARQGFLYPLGDEGSMALALSSLCIGGGVVGLRFGWKLWRGQ